MRMGTLFTACVLMAELAWPQAAAGKQIHVFVALCDNDAQGIVPVPKKIGNGDDPDANLYWGCTDGLKEIFKNAKQWSLVEEPAPPAPCILRRMVFKHKKTGAMLTADAYKGTEIEQCLQDFEGAASAGQCDLAAYIGHNGLMDFPLRTLARDPAARPADTIVLCCKSSQYFKDRIEGFGARPVLLTTQFMYPGAFLLRDALETWLAGGNRTAIREAAGKAYAANQKIAFKAARGVFADLENEGKR